MCDRVLCIYNLLRYQREFYQCTANLKSNIRGNVTEKTLFQAFCTAAAIAAKLVVPSLSISRECMDTVEEEIIQWQCELYNHNSIHSFLCTIVYQSQP